MYSINNTLLFPSFVLNYLFLFLFHFHLSHVDNYSFSTTSSSSSAIGLGYGIAIAVGIFVLISTITLASYICICLQSTTTVGPTNLISSLATPPAAAVILGFDGLTIDCYYPKFNYSRNHVDGGGGMVGPCAICLWEYEEGEAVRRMAECGHCFHARCVNEWLRMSATCPVCRNSPVPTPIATPLSELIPLAVHPR